nr:hypothetical protein [uncultured Allomuricauda sp.]
MNVIAPKLIIREAKIAMEGFTDLHEIAVEFKVKNTLNGSIMMAQPSFKDILKKKPRRKYLVLVSETFTIGTKTFSTLKLPSEIKIGWFAHELGHIQDYQSLSSIGLLRFGLLYLTSKKFMKSAELKADTFATQAGYGKYLVATKNFILNHAELPETYKAKIRRYYPSPDQILEIDKNLKTMEDIE